MIITINNVTYECESAKRFLDQITITHKINNQDASTSFFGENTVKTAQIIEGAWDYDGLSEPTQTDRIEAQVTYTAMMTNTLLEV